MCCSRCTAARPHAESNRVEKIVHRLSLHFLQKSRVETILEKAKQQNASNYSKCDVIESAQKLGITIWLLPKIQDWINKKKELLNVLGKSTQQKKQHSDPAHNQVEIRELKAPFIKFEDTNHESLDQCIMKYPFFF